MYFPHVRERINLDSRMWYRSERELRRRQVLRQLTIAFLFCQSNNYHVQKANLFYVTMAQSLIRLTLVLLILGSTVADDCVQVPQIIFRNMKKCSESLSKEDIKYLNSPAPKDGRLKCYALCFYTKIGYYKNGQFSLESMNQFLKEYIPNENLARRLQAWNIRAVKKANDVKGDDCERAYSFYKSNEEVEAQMLLRQIFC